MKKILILITILFSLYVCKNADVVSKNTNERISGSSANFGKPTAPVQLNWNSPKSTVIGATATIDYSATPSVNLEKLTLRIRLPENVEYVSGDKEITVNNKIAGEVISGKILVKSKTEALHFINLDAILKFNGIEQAANTNIQFQVGESQNLKKNNITTDSNGEKFLDIPAK
jgi:hypothetical protein